MKSALLIGGISAVVGGAMGLLGGAYTLRTFKPQPEVREVRVVERREKSAWADLVARQAQEQQATADHSGPGAVEKRESDEADPEPPRSHEELKRDWHERFFEKVTSATNEARDPSWARQVEQAFRSDFEQQRERMQAQLVSIDCKTRACLAHVQWSSYAVAQDLFPQIMHTAYATNCAVAIDIGDQPAKPEAPHQGTVVFECEREGAKASQGG